MKFRFQNYLFLALVLTCLQLYADINVVNVYSGIPQPADVGPNRTGGFGDVAANLVAAMELKRRYPDRVIRLMVTSADERYIPEVPTTNEIMKIMAPELDPNAKGVSQYYHGVEVIFIDFDFARLADTSKYEHLPERVEILLSTANLLLHRGKIRSQVPRADLNLSFSYHPYSWPIVSIGAPLSIGVEEVYEDQLGAAFFVRNRLVSPQKGFIKIVGGPRSVGYMMVKPQRSEQAWETIQTWLREKNIEAPEGRFAFTFGYTAIKESLQTYIYALGEMGLTSPLTVFVKKFEDMDYSLLPPNIRVVEVGGIPHQAMSALIQESAISPLATGDISLGQALSTLRDDKLFVYEAPWWKVGAARELRQIIAQELGVHTNIVKAMFLTPGTLINRDKETLLSKGSDLAQILKNKSLLKQIYTALSGHKRQWDVLENVLSYAERLDQSGSQAWTQKGLSEQLQAAVADVVSRPAASTCHLLF